MINKPPIRFVSNRKPGMVMVERLRSDGHYVFVGAIIRAKADGGGIVKKGDRIFMETEKPTNPKVVDTPAVISDPSYQTLKKVVIERHS